MRRINWILIAALLVFQSLLSAQVASARIQTLEGRLKILRADNFVTGVTTTTYYLLRSTDSSDPPLTLRFPGGLPDTPWRTGDKVTVQGEITDESMQVQSLQPLMEQYGSDGAVSALSRPEVAAAIEDRRAVILIINFKDAPNSLSVSDVAGFMYTNSRNVNDLFKASSFQQLGFDPDTDGNSSPDVFGPYTVNFNKGDGCREDDWASAADAAAQAAGVDLTKYQHKAYALPSEAACGWAGLGSVGCYADYCRVWVREGGGPVFAHELGHNLGWRHASTDPENDGAINSEYGDRSGIMGYPHWSQVNAPHRDQRQWFNAFPGSLQVAQASGTFEVHALELDPGVDTVGTQVVKVPKADSKENYYLSYRRRISDYPVHSDYADKINIHRKAGSGASSVHITNLGQGETFTDSANTITISANATGGATASVTVTISGAPTNNPPTASFSFSINHLSVQFADASSDSDGTISGRTWNFGDGTSSSQTNPGHTYARPGTYTIRLLVTDNDGATHTSARAVTVAAAPTNHPPTASFGFSVDNLSVQFTDASSDSDGTIAGRSWTFGDGDVSTQTNPVHAYTSPGTYTVSLVVADNDGNTHTSTQSVTTNMPPTADFNVLVSGRQATFNHTCSDSDGTIQSYTWDFGDGNGSTSANPVHTYADDGTYSVILAARDNDGASATISHDVGLSASETAAPTATPASGTGGGGSGGGCFIQGLLLKSKAPSKERSAQ